MWMRCRSAGNVRAGLLGISVAVLLALGLSACPGFELPPPTPPSLNPDPRLFETRYRYAAGQEPHALASADLNGNGWMDVVAVNRRSNEATVFLGGQTGLQAGVHYEVGSEPVAVVIADMNQSGHPDIVTANFASNDLTVLFNNGEGDFEEAVTVPLLSGAGPRDVVAVDLNEDGLLDLVTADSGSGTISVLLGTGEGAFAFPDITPAGLGTRSIVAADLNGNGHMDLATANRDSNDVTVFYGAGDATFSQTLRLPVGVNPRMVAAADLDGDGVPDLITSNPGSGDFSLRRGLGTLGFGLEQRLQSDFVPTRFALGDFNGNGRLDLAAILFSTGNNSQPLGLVAVYPGSAGMGFGTPRIFGAGDQSLDLIAAHVDKDGRTDLITAEAGGNAIGVLYGRAGGAFETEERFAVGQRPRNVVAADFNNDQHLDIAVVNAESRSVSVLLGNGDGTFQAPRTLNVDGTPEAIAVGRVDGDQHFDLVVTDIANHRAFLFRGRGDGSFDGGRVIALRGPGQAQPLEPRSVALGDLSGNGHLDIVTGNARADTVSVVLNLGEGNFLAPLEFFSGNYPLSVRIAPLDPGMELDIALVNGQDPADPPTQVSVTTIFGAGDGTLDPESRVGYVTGALPRSIAVGDINRNGRADMITGHDAGSQVQLYRNQGTGRFNAAVGLAAGSAPAFVQLADLTGDQFPEVLALSRQNRLSVLVNQRNFQFSSPVHFPVGSEPVGFIAADFTGNGVRDLVTVNQQTNDVSFLRGAR